MSEHADGEGDVTFRVRSFDGLEYSPITVKKYKLNLQAPEIVVNTPAQNSQHDSNSPKGSVISFSGIASCLLYTSPSPRDKRQSRMPSSA